MPLTVGLILTQARRQAETTQILDITYKGWVQLVPILFVFGSQELALTLLSKHTKKENKLTKSQFPNIHRPE